MLPLKKPPHHPPPPPAVFASLPGLTPLAKKQDNTKLIKTAHSCKREIRLYNLLCIKQRACQVSFTSKISQIWVACLAGGLEVVGARENGRARGRHARGDGDARLFFPAPNTSKRLPRRLEFPNFSFTTRYNSFFFRPSNSSLAKDIGHFNFHSPKTSSLNFRQLPVANGTASSKISKTEDNLARYTQIFDCVLSIQLCYQNFRNFFRLNGWHFGNSTVSGISGNFAGN